MIELSELGNTDVLRVSPFIIPPQQAPAGNLKTTFWGAGGRMFESSCPDYVIRY